MWRVKLWQGRFESIGANGVLEDEANLDVNEEWCNESTLKGIKKEGTIVTLQLHRD